MKREYKVKYQSGNIFRFRYFEDEEKKVEVAFLFPEADKEKMLVFQDKKEEDKMRDKTKMVFYFQTKDGKKQVIKIDKKNRLEKMFEKLVRHFSYGEERHFQEAKENLDRQVKSETQR